MDWNYYYSGIDNYLSMTTVHEEVVNYILERYAQTLCLDSSRVLDVGGGPGIHLDMISSQIRTHCYNIDNSEEAIRKGQGVFHDITKTPWPFISQFFDLVYSIQVLEHLDENEIRRVLLEVKRVVKPNGKVFLSVATTNNIQEDHKTLQPFEWWSSLCLQYGLKRDFQVKNNPQFERSFMWQSLFLVPKG